MRIPEPVPSSGSALGYVQSCFQVPAFVRWRHLGAIPSECREGSGVVGGRVGDELNGPECLREPSKGTDGSRADTAATMRSSDPQADLIAVPVSLP